MAAEHTPPRARVPRSVARLLAVTERRLARARRRGRLGEAVAEARRPKALPAITRLSASRAVGRVSAARDWTAPVSARAVGAVASGIEVARTADETPPAPEVPIQRPAWWGELADQFGVGDEALQYMFGDQRLGPGDAGLPPGAAPAPDPGAPSPPPPAPDPSATLARAPSETPAAPPARVAAPAPDRPRQQRIIEGPAPRGDSGAGGGARRLARVPTTGRPQAGPIPPEPRTAESGVAPTASTSPGSAEQPVHTESPLHGTGPEA
jgi:hypothetical protein